MKRYSKKIERGLRHMLMAASAVRDDISGEEGRKKEAADLDAAIVWLEEQMIEMTHNGQAYLPADKEHEKR